MRTIYIMSFLISFLTFSEISSGQTPNDCHNLHTDCNNCQDCIKNKNVKKLIYDFECKLFYFDDTIVTSLNDLKLKKDESIILQIENVNRYIYNVEVDVAELKYISEVPAMFSSLMLGEGLEIPISSNSSASIADDATDEAEVDEEETADPLQEAFTALSDIIQTLPSFKDQLIPEINLPKLKAKTAQDLATDLLEPINKEFDALTKKIDEAEILALTKITTEKNLFSLDTVFTKLKTSLTIENEIQTSLENIENNSPTKYFLVNDTNDSFLKFQPLDKENILAQTLQTILIPTSTTKMKSDLINLYNKKFSESDTSSIINIEGLKSIAEKSPFNIKNQLQIDSLKNVKVQKEFTELYKLNLIAKFNEIKKGLDNKKISVSSEINNYVISEFFFNNTTLDSDEIKNENLSYFINLPEEESTYDKLLKPSYTNELIVENSKGYLGTLNKMFGVPTLTLESYLLNLLNSGPKKTEEPSLEKDRKEILALMSSLLSKQIDALSECEVSRPCCDEKEDLDFIAIKEKIDDYKSTFEKTTLEIKSKISKQKSKIEELIKTNTKCIELTKKQEEEKDDKKKKELQEELKKLKCSEVENEIKLANEILKKFETELAEVELTSKEILALNNEDIINLILFARNYTAENYIYRVPIYFPTTSLTDLAISITPLADTLMTLKPQIPFYNQSNSISVFQKGHWNVGFSTGPFITIGKSLSDQRYVWKNQIESTLLGNDTTVLKLVRNDKRNRFMGLASTLNLNCQVTRSFSCGFSFGAGLSIEEKPRQNYLGGVNLSFGMSHPIVIGAGILTTRVDRFNDLIYGDPNLSYKEKSEIEYNRIWTTGGYLMVSYSITKVNKEKKASNK